MWILFEVLDVEGNVFSFIYNESWRLLGWLLGLNWNDFWSTPHELSSTRILRARLGN